MQRFVVYLLCSVYVTMVIKFKTLLIKQKFQIDFKIT